MDDRKQNYGYKSINVSDIQLKVRVVVAKNKSQLHNVLTDSAILHEGFNFSFVMSLIIWCHAWTLYCSKYAS